MFFLIYCNLASMHPLEKLHIKGVLERIRYFELFNLFLDPAVTCAESKILNKILPTNRATATFRTTSEGRVIATITCDDGYSFVHPKKFERKFLLISEEWSCHPQHTALFISEIFGHYIPKCVRKYRNQARTQGGGKGGHFSQRMIF